MKKRLLVGAIAALAALSPTALAADHMDGPQAMGNPMLDITDLYAWTDASGTALDLIMDLTPNASKTSSLFSDQGQYVFNITSYSAYPAPPGLPAGNTSQVICTFAGTTAPQIVSCWLVVNGNTVDYAKGNATALTGITSVNADFQVFTGPRQDPFFFNLAGFNNTITAVESVAPTVKFNQAGCPELDGGVVATLVNDLGTAADGSQAVDFFAGFDVLSIVVQVKTAAVTPVAGHPVVGVWAGTYL
jgi:hypothetical protein